MWKAVAGQSVVCATPYAIGYAKVDANGTLSVRVTGQGGCNDTGWIVGPVANGQDCSYGDPMQVTANLEAVVVNKGAGICAWN